jgi:hypothetical protein
VGRSDSYDENLLDDLRDLTLAVSRVLVDDGTRISFDDLLSAYGLSRTDLAAIPDDSQPVEGGRSARPG